MPGSNDELYRLLLQDPWKCFFIYPLAMAGYIFQKFGQKACAIYPDRIYANQINPKPVPSPGKNRRVRPTLQVII